jgi:invasion protein IalB
MYAVTEARPIMRVLRGTFLALALSAAAVPAMAQPATQLSKHNDWATYAYSGDKGKVCYVLSAPTDKQPTSLDHGDVFFFVSQKPGQNVAFEPQFLAGYQFQADSKVTIAIGDKSFSLFTRGKSAWRENAAEEPALIAAMKGGSEMKIAAKSGRGNATNYVFSLKGITAALDSIRACK